MDYLCEVGEGNRKTVGEVHRGPCSPSLELRVRYRLYIQKMKLAAIDPAYASYRVGPGGIELGHIHIASLEQVSRGSWQPRLIYSGP